MQQTGDELIPNSRPRRQAGDSGGVRATIRSPYSPGGLDSIRACPITFLQRRSPFLLSNFSRIAHGAPLFRYRPENQSRQRLLCSVFLTQAAKSARGVLARKHRVPRAIKWTPGRPSPTVGLHTDSNRSLKGEESVPQKLATPPVSVRRAPRSHQRRRPGQEEQFVSLRGAGAAPLA